MLRNIGKCYGILGKCQKIPGLFRMSWAPRGEPLEILVRSAFWVSRFKASTPPQSEALKPQKQEQEQTLKTNKNKQNQQRPKQKQQNSKHQNKAPKRWCKLKFSTPLKTPWVTGYAPPYPYWWGPAVASLAVRRLGALVGASEAHTSGPPVG